jgi:L-lactate dehydrogenase complex protein LldG
MGKLREAVRQGNFSVPETTALPAFQWDREERIGRLKGLLENMHAEVLCTTHADWVSTLKEILRQRAPQTLVYGPGTGLAEALETNWESDLPALVPYQQDIENFKDTLFGADAGITSTRGAIAETGALVLWPSAEEPRLLSLVPALHIAVLEADRIHDTFAEMMAAERWQDGMPTNALLISGPSKTADIELTLTFGVHGPKELLVLILDN